MVGGVKFNGGFPQMCSLRLADWSVAEFTRIPTAAPVPRSLATSATQNSGIALKSGDLGYEDGTDLSRKNVRTSKFSIVHAQHFAL
jgi:hypothetical protein